VRTHYDEPMSYWEHRKPVQRARAVDIDAVARASRDALDAGGLRALTLRAVAGELGVAPASLYSRVSGVEDLFDLALDAALGEDSEVRDCLERDDLHRILLAFFGHLIRHPWACHVIGFRAPRGPHYLHLSERLCTLLEEAGSSDPLTASYALSNFVIGSAMTAPISGDERAAPVDERIAPHYAALHARHRADPQLADPQLIVDSGLSALLAQLTRA
jgi:AcrR family transcriptional regulator